MHSCLRSYFDIDSQVYCRVKLWQVSQQKLPSPCTVKPKSKNRPKTVLIKNFVKLTGHTFSLQQFHRIWIWSACKYQKRKCYKFAEIFLKNSWNPIYISSQLILWLVLVIWNHCVSFYSVSHQLSSESKTVKFFSSFQVCFKIQILTRFLLIIFQVYRRWEWKVQMRLEWANQQLYTVIIFWIILANRFTVFRGTGHRPFENPVIWIFDVGTNPDCWAVRISRPNRSSFSGIEKSIRMVKEEKPGTINCEESST